MSEDGRKPGVCVYYPGFADYHRFGEAVIIKTSGMVWMWTEVES